MTPLEGIRRVWRQSGADKHQRAKSEKTCAVSRWHRAGGNVGMASTQAQRGIYLAVAVAARCATLLHHAFLFRRWRTSPWAQTSKYAPYLFVAEAWRRLVADVSWRRALA